MASIKFTTYGANTGTISDTTAAHTMMSHLGIGGEKVTKYPDVVPV